MGQSISTSMAEAQKSAMREIQDEMVQKNYELQVRASER